MKEENTANAGAYCANPDRQAFSPVRSIREIPKGTTMQLGRRRWQFAGTTDELPEFKHEQEETVWLNVSPEPGAVDRRRIMAWSEVEALMDRGVPFSMEGSFRLVFPFQIQHLV